MLYTTPLQHITFIQHIKNCFPSTHSPKLKYKNTLLSNTSRNTQPTNHSHSTNSPSRSSPSKSSSRGFCVRGNVVAVIGSRNNQIAARARKNAASHNECGAAFGRRDKNVSLPSPPLSPRLQSAVVNRSFHNVAKSAGINNRASEALCGFAIALPPSVN